MTGLFRRRRGATRDRLVWHAAALLLSYPDDGLQERLRVVADILGHLTPDSGRLLAQAHRYLYETDPYVAAAQYVETFDLRRRTTPYLTYWTAGDTRNRGREILAFADTYRRAGVEPPKDESADHLIVVLEFAALVDAAAGAALLSVHRVPLDLLQAALGDTGSPYAAVVAAVCGTLPPASDRDVARARQLAAAGPPAEAVGLGPFTLTVPPRREGAT
ncbi:nitrate reductase molybdenum cofactor assembly chaperone [Rhodococcus opacus]|uniref:Nitrate reductase accessory protein NarJ n=1 Tax=Rhodococcus opacus (strain B4) TaxID=632772 RepID=C1B350_RHOOB|nr:nitrate reductase molybdenum cofactor assembly chaperone [Rhodococcus opacus]BAH54967.1 nitrate reductase accessory protein NarJ [Rhodococcus opacus B4]